MTPEYEQVLALLPRLTLAELQDLKLNRIAKAQREVGQWNQAKGAVGEKAFNGRAKKPKEGGPL